MKPAHELLILK